MTKIVVGLAITVAVALVSFGLVASAARPRPEPPHLVSMQEGARALLADAGVMQAHGQAMLETGQRDGSKELLTRGEHWLKDGHDLALRAQWLAMDPMSPANLDTPPTELSRQAAWGALTTTARAMLHDPTKARTAVDLEAVRWNGLAMQAEGRNMADYGRVMAEEVEVMLAQHAVDGQSTTALRQAARSMQTVGGHLAGNGQEMIDYAERMRRVLGRP
jgi:hypothetical protein